MAQILKICFEKCPNISFLTQKLAKKNTFWGNLKFFTPLYNPLTTNRHICPTIFSPRRRCAYLQIAHKRLKIWKESAAILCFSWNCASNEPNYRSIAIVVPKIGAVKVSRCLSEKLRKSQNLMVDKGLTWSKFWTKYSKNANILPNISFLTQKLAKKHFLGKFEIFHTSV